MPTTPISQRGRDTMRGRMRGRAALLQGIIKVYDYPNPYISPFMPTFTDILPILTHYLHLGDLIKVASTSLECSDLVHHHIKERKAEISTKYFNHPTTLYEILHICDAVVSGSHALRILLPTATTSWEAKDLDIYVSAARVGQLINLLCREGCELAAVDAQTAHEYASSSVKEVISLWRQQHRIDVIISGTDDPITPVFEFHSTVIMNFITAEAICCAYPSLTLRQKSIVNPYALYQHPLGRTSLGSWEKYEERGIEYTCCPCNLGRKRLCCCKACSLLDGACMWVNVLALPCAPYDPAAIFEQLGVFDVEWRLGGCVCGCLDALMAHCC